VRAIAIKDGLFDSDIASAVFIKVVAGGRHHLWIGTTEPGWTLKGGATVPKNLSEIDRNGQLKRKPVGRVLQTCASRWDEFYGPFIFIKMLRRR